jgi:hypothetical protein
MSYLRHWRDIWGELKRLVKSAIAFTICEIYPSELVNVVIKYAIADPNNFHLLKMLKLSVLAPQNLLTGVTLCYCKNLKIRCVNYL